MIESATIVVESGATCISELNTSIDFFNYLLTLLRSLAFTGLALASSITAIASLVQARMGRHFAVQLGALRRIKSRAVGLDRQSEFPQLKLQICNADFVCTVCVNTPTTFGRSRALW